MNPLMIPLFIQVFFTFALLFVLAFFRVRAVLGGRVKAQDIVLGQPAWPPFEQSLSNCFHNQLETPILFYLAILLCLHFDISSVLILVSAWLYIASRFVHAFIEIRTNHLRNRFRAFLLGTLALLAMWIILFVILLVKTL